MARPVTPIAIHKTRGTLRARRMASAEVELVLTPGSIGDAPAWFDDEMRAEWERVTSDCELKRVLAPAHRPTVEHHCLLYKRFLQDARGERQMMASERQTYHSIQMQLGWTPASQSKVHSKAEQKADDPWAALG